MSERETEMVRVTKIPGLYATPHIAQTEETVAYQEWIIPKEAYLAVTKKAKIEAYEELEQRLKSHNHPQLYLAYVSYLVDKLKDELEAGKQ